MKILFDHGTPAPLRHALADHVVATAYEMGWSEIDNGSLLAAAENDFDVLITTDQSMRHQQNTAGRRLAFWFYRPPTGDKSRTIKRKSWMRSTEFVLAT